MFEDVINFIQDTYKTKEFIPLHEPKFIGNEKQYLNECINSTFVSSVGQFVDKFESKVADGAKYAIAAVNGTSALHIAMLLANIESNDEVITQSLNFVATCNAISYCGAHPIFIDVDKDTMWLSLLALTALIEDAAESLGSLYKGMHTGTYGEM